MIKIKIDLIPFGFLKRKPLKEIHIINDGTGTPTTGNYKYDILSRNGRVYRSGTIKGFKRKQKDVLYLLGMVLKNEGYLS